MIYAFEGADASGKATQTKILTERFNRLGQHAKRWEFPNYGSLTGAAISTNLRKVWTVDKPSAHPDLGEKGMSELVFQCLFIVDRLEQASELSKYRANPEEHAILDRYTMSSIVYGGVNGLPDEWLWQVQEHLPQPDMWFYLDIPIEESIKRRPDRRDRIELDIPYLKKVRQRYLSIFHNERHADRLRWHIINAMDSVGSVSEKIWDQVIHGSV